ncbi:MAG: GGDEF domain-containing protein, partial [Pirellulales bacterium]
EKLTELRSFVERHGQPFVLSVFDVDRFKSLNDSAGHSAGDAVLAMLGRLMRECRRGTDHVARIGGEEFVLLVPRCHLDQAELIAERYRQRIESARLKFSGHDLKVTISAGIAEYRDGESKGALLARADAAMYAAKRAGGNRVCRHDHIADLSATQGHGKG